MIVPHWLVAALLATNVVLVLFNLRIMLSHTHDAARTFIDDDFPISYPFSLKEVAMFVEDTQHYQLDNHSEWESLIPRSGGFVHLGPDYVPYGLSMFHQFHCLDMIRTSLLSVSASQNASLPLPIHTKHCLGYLRQMILCAADTHLEPVIPYFPAKAVDSSGLHRCRDWEDVYTEVEKNEKEWRQSQQNHKVE